MTLEILFMIVLIGVAMVAFVREVFPIEVTAMGVLAVLVATNTIGVDEALSGFSSTAVVAIASLFVLSHALTKTGLLETIADRLGDRAHVWPWGMVVLLLVAVAIGSGLLNNTAVVAIAIPIAMKLSRRLRLSPSRVLMPLSYVSMLGGTLTLIGTSTNLLVSSVVEDAGEPPLGMFEFTLMGSVLLAVGLLYVVLGARRLLPARADIGGLTGKYRVGGFLTELILDRESKLAGHTLSEAHVNERYGVTVLEVVRGPAETHVQDVEAVALQIGDRLIVQGSLDDILRLRRDHGLALLPDVELDDQQLAAGGHALVEAWVAPGSAMVGRTLKQLDFHHHYGAYVLAIRRIGATLRKQVANVRLRFADALLILVPRERIVELEEARDLVVLSEHEVHLRRGRMWWLVLVVLPLVVAAAATGVVDIAAAALVGAVVLLLARVMTPEEAYHAINWPVVFMIAAFVPLGHAFQVTGTADLLARGLLRISAWAPAELAPYVVLSAVYLATSVLTQIASNGAAAIVVTPIALSVGPALGVDPRPLVFAVCFAASAAFMTPMGYQTNLMVYTAGEYRFVDYARFGAPLNLLLWLLATLMIPYIWPF